MPMINNVSPQEIAKFNALASQWWDLQGPCKPLHEINPLRLGFIQQHAGDLNGKRILDIGCGGGILTESLANLGAKMTGIDLSADAIEVAKDHAAKQKLSIEYLLTDTATLVTTKKDQPYDIITCMELLEHVPDPQALIQECTKLIKPHGKLFFSTINRNLKAYLFAIIGAEHILRWLPKGTHEYEKFIRPHELTQWARQANIQVDALAGISYHPWTREFRLNNDVSVNYLACATFHG